MFSIVYRKRAIQEFSNLDLATVQRIKISIDSKLMLHPQEFGKPLQNSLRGLRVFRVGDWRVIFTLEAMCISILTIRHRKKGYGDLSL